MFLSHATMINMGPHMVPKRNFSMGIPNIAVAPGKKFGNPNFVNNVFPSTLNHQIDNKNSSNLIEIIKKKCPQALGDMCKKQKRTRTSRNPVKTPRKNSKHNRSHQLVNEMIDVQNIVETPLNVIEKVEIIPRIERDASVSSSEDSFVIFDRSNENKDDKRDRQVSLCESEDSFVVFEGSCCGSDTESDVNETDTDSDESDSDIEPDPDSSYSVIENKRVRFADDSQLCEIHPMIKWSYAYQAARRGPWETYARDRDRFKQRIFRTERDIKHVFDTQHRDKIYKERFMEDMSM